MEIKLKCAVYTRVSTDIQAEKEYNSCEAQLEKIKSFVNSQENLEFYKVYNDPGYSGASLNRPALQQLLVDITTNKINCVLTYKIDRLTRSPKDFYYLVELFDRHKVDFISVTERFDTSTPSGRLLRNIMLTFAQFERELTSERTRDKMLQRAAKGMWNGGIAAFGYKVVDKKPIVRKNEAEILKFIFETFIKCESVAKTYEILKEKGIFDRKCQIFSKTTLAYMLKNPFYTGKFRYSKNIYKGTHEAIISEEEFERAQNFFGPKHIRINFRRPFLFAGILTCKECHSVMTPSSTNKGTRKRYYYYRCTSTFRHTWGRCGTKQISAKRLEYFITEKLKELSRDEDYLYNFTFRMNHESGGRSGLEPQEEKSIFDHKVIQSNLLELLKSLNESSEIDRISAVKNSIKAIEYSKEKIYVTLYYKTPCADENLEFSNCSRPHPTAVDFLPNKNRSTYGSTPTLNSLVACLKQTLTSPIILSNEIHSCKGKSFKQRRVR